MKLKQSIGDHIFIFYIEYGIITEVMRDERMLSAEDEKLRADPALGELTVEECLD